MLAQLSSEISDAQVAGAQAALQAAEAAATMAEDLAERQAKLQGQGSVSDLQSRTSAAQAEQAEAQVLAAKAQAARPARPPAPRPARALLRHSHRRARAGGRHGGPGRAAVHAGAPGLAAAQDHGGGGRARRAQAGRRCAWRPRAAGPARRGHHAHHAPLRGPGHPPRPVEVVVPNTDGRFVANTLARAMLPLGKPRRTRLLAVTALSSSGGDHVYVVERGEAAPRGRPGLERRAREVVVKAAEPLAQVIDHPAWASRTARASRSSSGSRRRTREPPMLLSDISISGRCSRPWSPCCSSSSG